MWGLGFREVYRNCKGFGFKRGPLRVLVLLANPGPLNNFIYLGLCFTRERVDQEMDAAVRCEGMFQVLCQLQRLPVFPKP